MKKHYHTDNNGNRIFDVSALGINVVNPSAPVEINSKVVNDFGLRFSQVSLDTTATSTRAKALGVSSTGFTFMASSLGFADTRNVNEKPKELTPEKYISFKTRALILNGSTVVPTNAGYARIEGNRAYGFATDWSGGGATRSLYDDTGRQFVQTMKDGDTWNKWQEFAPRNRTNTEAVYGSQDASDTISQDLAWGSAGVIGYDANRVVLNHANCAARFSTRIPLIKNKNYILDVEVTKIAGAGTVYIGVAGFTNTEAAITAWAFSAVSPPVGVPTRYKMSLTTAQVVSMMTAGSGYADVVVLANYGGANGAITRVESVELKITDVTSLQSSGNFVSKAGVVCEINSNSVGEIGSLVIKTKIPANSATMFRFALDGYSYDATAAWSAEVGSYMYVSNDFYNSVLAGYRKHPNLSAGNVKLGLRNGFVCIILGAATSSWSYPKVTVRDLTLGHSGASAAALDNWTMQFENAASVATILNQAAISVA
jgi:hypothetical protein